MKKTYLLLLISFLLITAILVFSLLLGRSLPKTVTIDSKEFKIELAKTENQREKGLMDRTSLDADSGMLFVFPKSEIQAFWMKNTLIPLDIIWIDNDRIVDIQTLQPESENNIPQYSPKEKANYVLEINAGLAEKYNFKIGDEVKLNY